MENSETFSPLKNAMNFGAMLGLSSILISFLTQVFGIRESMIPSLLTYAIMVLFIVLGANFFKKNNNGFMSYGEGVQQGVLTSLFASILTAFFIYTFFRFISPESLQEMRDMVEIQMEEQAKSEKEFEMAMKIQNWIISPGPLAVMTILTNTLFGLFASLITTAFLKNEDNSFESNFK